MSSKLYTVSVVQNGSHSDAALEVAYLPSRQVQLIVKLDTLVVEEHATDSFSALQGLRRKLQKKGLDLFCYGSSRNVFPSAMSREGSKAYKTFLGQHGRSTDLVDIFEKGPDIEMASVEEQDAFHRQWFESLGKK
jgi:hypothetical protein